MAEENEKTSKKKFIVLGIIVSLCLGLLSVGLFFWHSKKVELEEEQAGEVQYEEISQDEVVLGLAYPLNPFTVNLKDGRFLRFTLAIKFQKEIPNVFFSKEYELRDKIITLFNTKSSSEIINPDSRQELKKTLISTIKSVIGIDSVEDIFFLELVAQ